MAECPNAEQLEQYAVGACGAEDAAAIRAHVAQCPRCAQWLEDAWANQAVLGDVQRVLRAGDVPSDLPPQDPPAAIGGYRIVRQIGAGGMGIVYEAQQERPRRTVALKVIKPGVTTPEVLRRFEHEAQILGRLQHPGIAQIFEAGTADCGQGPQPFFAMELIVGQRLTDHAADRNLGTRARLALFAKICDAVLHAHQKGIIHRDLKPGNILVDDAGQPKILDFGVARATDADVQMTTLHTDIGRLIGTLPYMSPEQVAGDPGALDTRSDVYSLGVVLYELLAGRLPYDLRHKIIPEVARVIRDADPTPLSSINRVFRGDVETIVAKALEKDVGRRYQSAAALAGDIERYLRDEPITARRAGTWYQLRKFARRNRTLVGGVLAALLFLTLGVIGTSWQAVRATRAEILARRERDAALTAQQAEAAHRVASDRVREFLEKMLASVDPQQARGPDVTVREILDAAGRRIDTTSPGEVLVEAAVRDTIGLTYYHLGVYDQAETQLRAALALREEAQGVDHLDTADTLNNLALVLEQRGDLDAAEDLYRRALRIMEPQLGRHPTTATVLRNLGGLLRERAEYAAAEEMLREAVSIARETLGDAHAETADQVTGLAILLDETGRRDEAGALLREALQITRAAYGDRHVLVAVALNNVASLLQEEGDYDAAEQMYREALSIRTALLDADHPDVATSLSNLANLLQERGEYAEAEELYRRALEIRQGRLGPTHRDVADTLTNLASVLDDRGEMVAAEQLYRQAVDVYRQALGNQHPRLATCLNNLGELLRTQGDYDAAEPLCREALDIFRAAHGDEHESVAWALHNLAAIYKSRGDLDAAEPLYREALALSRKLMGARHPNVASTLANLASLRKGQGEYAEAERLYREALDIRREYFGNAHPAVAFSLNNLAETLRAAGKYDDAAPLYEEALKIFRDTLGNQHRYVATTLYNLAALREQQDDLVAAEPLWLECYDVTKTAYGEAHTETADVIGRIIDMYEAANKPDQAAEWRALPPASQPTSGPR